MKQRFGIAQALLGNPKLIIVDEPTAGLDPTERNRFLNLLSSIGSDVIVILSTHIVEDVRELCSQMAIIHDGGVILQGAPQDAIDELRNRVWRKSVNSNEEMSELDKNLQIISTQLTGGVTQARIYAETCPGEGFTPINPDLEDVYFMTLSRHQRN
jgi:ABC-type multidrug transport system ATPase subunit